MNNRQYICTPLSTTIFISILIRSMDLNIVQHWQFSLSPSHTPPPPSALQQTLDETPPQCNQPPSPGEESTQQNPSDTTTTITTTNISEIISQNICYFTNNGFPYPVQCVHAIACSSFHNHILLPTIPRNRNEFFNFNSCPISNIFQKLLWKTTNVAPHLRTSASVPFLITILVFFSSSATWSDAII